MVRPCTCLDPSCRPCWLAANDPRYQRAWGLPETLGRMDGEPLDPGQVGATRHLLFHCYPIGDFWLWHAAQLGQRIHLFNGRKVMAVVTDDRSASVSQVRQAMPYFDEVIECPNDPDLREVVTFEPLFSRVADLMGESDATLWMHAKGVRHPSGHPTILPWVAALYETLLDHWPAVLEVLRDYPVAGSFKKLGQGWPDHVTRSDWHYSGSFVWFRNRDVFPRPDWRQVAPFWSGIEFWPSNLFPRARAGVVFYEDRLERMNLYDAAVWEMYVVPALEQWRAAHAHQRSPAGPAALLRIELGGGPNPRGQGFLNVDRHAPADIVCDLNGPWPFADASVAEVYSSHCLEHVENLPNVLRELVRVCRVGAKIEIRVPHPNNPMAMCWDHHHVISDDQVRHWVRDFPRVHFAGCARRLLLLDTRRIPTSHFQEARPLFPHLTEDQVFRFVAGTCHESRYTFEVVPNEFAS